MEQQKEGSKTYSCLENTLIAPISLSRLLHLVLGSLRINNAILSRNLLLIPLSILPLLILILLQPILELILQTANLGILSHRAAGPLSICLEKLDLVSDLRVEDLRLGNEVLERGRGR
jgi:hypothetical protein